jgi:hypothetical protein
VCEIFSCSIGTCRVVDDQPRCVCEPGDSTQAQGCNEDREGNDAQSTATPTVPSAWHQAAIEPLGDVDFYALQVKAGRTYRFTCVPETLGACRMDLLSPAGAVGVVSRPPYAVDGQRGYTARVSALAGVDATWYLVVAAGDGGAPDLAGRYRYRLEELGPDDHGDTLETATALNPAGEMGVGTAEQRGDLDLFSFTAEAGHVYSFACAAYGPPTCQLSLLDEQGREDRDLNAWGFKAPKSGTWYVKRTDNYLSTPGSFWYTFTPGGPDDHGDTAATATPISFPASIQGTMEYLGDRDYFSFTGVAGHLFRLKSAPRSGTYFQVWDPTGAAVTLTLAPTGDISYGSLRMDGRYVIRASNLENRHYASALEDLGMDDAGDTPQTAALLGVGGVAGHLMPSGDVDYFRLELEAGRAYELRCSGNQFWTAACRIGLEAGAPMVVSDVTSDPSVRVLRVQSGVDQSIRVRLESDNGTVFLYLLEVRELG